jgi:hypothetical protein
VGNRFYRKLTWYAPKAPSSLFLPALLPDLAKAIAQLPVESELRVEYQDLPQFGRPAMSVLIHGPVDVLRWLADDLDAIWLTGA